MADFTQQDGKWVRQRAVTKAQVEAGVGQAKNLLGQWQDDFATMDATQRWVLVRSTMILLLRVAIYLARKRLQQDRDD